MKLETLNNIITNKIQYDIYELGDGPIPDIKKYDIILIGNSPTEDDNPTNEMINFLNNCDMSQKDVSLFWVGAMNSDLFEANITKYIKNGNILPGLGFNNDEISEVELISHFIDGWLTSVFYQV